MEPTQGHAATGDQMNTQQRIEHITALAQYRAIRAQTLHKMRAIPVCKFDQ